MSDEQLTDVRKGHELNKAKLGNYLSKEIPGFDAAISIRQFEGGQSNPTYLLESAGRRYVLRKKPPGKLLTSAHMVEREYRIMHGLRESPCPVPRVHLLCEDEDIIGTTFFIMDYVEGRLLKNPALPNSSPEDRREVYLEMNRVLGSLHCIDPREYGLENFGKTGNYFQRQVDRWTKQYLAAKTDEIESMECLMKWLAVNVPADDSSSIVHGDYLLNNMMFDSRRNEIIAVFDWELSTLGHPLADLAYNCMPYYMNTSGPTLNEMIDSGVPSETEYLDLYCKNTGRSGIENWNFYLAFSFFRFASIVQGVYKRGIDGNASSDHAQSLGPLVAGVGDLAWNLADA